MYCDDCGDQVEEQNLCVIMVSPLNGQGGFHRISNLCKRCQGLKVIDARKAYPPRQRPPVRLIRAPLGHLLAFELLKKQWVTEPAALSRKPLWLYGKGELGQMAQLYFNYTGVEVAGWFEYDEPAPLDAQVAVCIVRNTPYSEIEQKLQNRGFRDIVPFYDLTDSIITDHPWKNGWIGKPLPDEFERMKWVLENLDDNVSRAHYLSFLAWRILREEWLFDGISVTKDNLFFIPEIIEVLHDHEVFLDAGACYGEMTERLLQLAPNSEVIAIEPDDKNRMDFVKKHNVTVHGFALSNLEDKAQFSQGFGYCSKLSPKGNTVKITRKVDNLNIKPTFIKCHLEGGDLEALKGAKETLKHCRPIVAVRVDHNSDGLWKTADYLMKLLPNYRFLFRNHCYCGAAAVVYAIPNEREPCHMQ